MLNKRKLSGIKRAEATDEMVDIAKRLNDKWIVTAELVMKKKILLLNFFRVEDLKREDKKAVMRTFLSKNDYITQDLSVSNVKWITSAFHNMNRDICYEVWTPERNRVRNFVYINSTVEKDLIEYFFKEYPDDENVWNSVYKFQKAVMKDRLDKRHKKETDAIDAIMKTVKPLPKKVKKWITNVKLPKYVVYKAVGKNKVECECTYCRNKFTADRKELNLKNNGKGICPECGKPVIFKARGRLGAVTEYSKWLAYIDPTDDGFIMRYFNISRYLNRLDLSFKDNIHEGCRVFYSFDGEKMSTKSFEWTYYKRGELRWCKDNNKVLCSLCMLYPENLPEAWAHTPMKYSALEILSKNIPDESIHYQWAIEKYRKFPELEWLCKMNLNNLALNIIENNYGIGRLDFKGKTIYEILGLNKIYTRILQEIDGNSEELLLLQTAKKEGIRVRTEQIKEFYEIYGCNTRLLRESGKKVTLHKIMKYIEKESLRYISKHSKNKNEVLKNTAGDWLDYLGWCQILNYDLKNMFIYMPTNFKKVHDRTAEEYKAFKDKEAVEKKERFSNIIKQINKEHSEISVFNMHYNGLFVRLPKDGEEIENEGRYLHHCVATYTERVAKGETLIFFVRKETEPDTPYYTLEWQGEVIQCRGNYNSAMTDDVKNFVNKFTKEMFKYNKQTRERTAS